MNDGDCEILGHFTTIRNRTIELVRRAPDELLGRTADGESQPLCSLFTHIAGGGNWWMHNVMGDGQGPPSAYECDKDSILQALGTSRDRVVTFFSAQNGQRMGQTFSFTDKDGTITTWTGRNRVLYLTDHEIHHRGKIVLALRQWNFTDLLSLTRSNDAQTLKLGLFD